MRTDILTAENRIFYYQMIDIGNNFSLLSTRSPLDTIIVTYRDNSVYNDLRIGFAKLYGIPIAEKQLYAARDLRYLQLNGYKLSGDEKRWLVNLANKKGKVLACSGCTYWNRPISGELNDLKNTDKDMLLAKP